MKEMLTWMQTSPQALHGSQGFLSNTVGDDGHKWKWIGLSQTHNTSRTHSYTKNNREALPRAATQSTIESDVCCSQAEVEVRGKKAQAHNRREAFSRRTIRHRTFLRGCDRAAKNDNVIAGDDILFKKLMTEWSHVSVTVAATDSRSQPLFST